MSRVEYVDEAVKKRNSHMSPSS